MATRKHREKEYAKTLYLAGDLTQKEIAERVGVTEKTLGKWIVEEKWESMRKSLLTTRQAQLTSLYDQLEAISTEIKTRPVVYDFPDFLLKPVKLKDTEGNEYLEFPVFDKTDYPIKIGNFPTAKDADIIAKITKSIKQLETETSIAEIFEVARDVINFVRAYDLALAKQMTDAFDLFIQSKMK